MAELGIDWKADEISDLLAEGRDRDAITKATQYLRAGYASPEFLNVITNLLNRPPKKRGRPRRERPMKWIEIGSRFDELRYDGLTVEKCVLALEEEFARSVSTIERVLAFYREAKKESDRILREEE